MNVDKWSWCGQFLIINRPCAIIVLLGLGWVMLWYIVQVGFWIELPIQKRLCPIFVKLGIPVNGTQRCGIELHDIHKHSMG